MISVIYECCEIGNVQHFNETVKIEKAQSAQSFGKIASDFSLCVLCDSLLNIRSLIAVKLQIVP